MEKTKKKHFSVIRAEWVKNLRKFHSIIRMIGTTDYVCGFVRKMIDKDFRYLRGDHDKIFYSEGFVNSFGFGGVVVFDTDNKTIANKLLAIIEDKNLNLGGCHVAMHPDFYCILRFDGLKTDDYFLNGRLNQL